MHTNPSKLQRVFDYLLMLEVLAIATSLAGWMAMPLIRGGYRMFGDLIWYHYPVRWAYRESLLHGHSFAWNPWIGCGTYIHAEGQAGMCHPLHLLLYRFVDAASGLHAEAAFGFVLAMAGTWLFFRRWGLRHSISLWGGCLYAFCAINLLDLTAPNIVTIMAHAPWALWTLDIFLTGSSRGRRLAGIMGFALVTGSELLLGYPQAVVMCGFMGTAYLLTLSIAHAWSGGADFQWKILLNAFAAFIGANLLGLALGAAQVLPHLDLYAATGRAHPPDWWRFAFGADFRSLLELFAGPLGAINPIGHGVYAGLPALFAALWGLTLLRRTRRTGGGSRACAETDGLVPSSRPCRPLLLFALVCMLLGFAMAFGGYSPFYRAVSSLPLLQSFRSPIRYCYLIHFALACFATVGLSNLCERKRGGRAAARGLLPPLMLLGAVLTTTLCAAARLGAAWIPWYPPALQLVWIPLMGVAAFLMLAAGAFGWRWVVILLPLLQALDTCSYITHADQIPGTSRWSHEALIRDVTPPSDPGGQRVYCRLNEKEPITGNNLPTISGIRNAVGYTGVSLDENCLHYVPENPNTLRVAAVSWVRTLSAKDTAWTPLTDPLPLARLVTKVVVSSSPGDIIESTDVRNVAIVEKEVPGLDATAEPGTATIVSQTPGEYGIRTSCKTPQLLVVSERYWRGWHVRIDQEPGPELLRAYGDFMGCVVPAGTHVVEFRFDPVSFRLGVLVSLLALGGCLGILGVLLRLRYPGSCRNVAGHTAGYVAQSTDPPHEEVDGASQPAAAPADTKEIPAAPARTIHGVRRGLLFCTVCLSVLVLPVIVGGFNTFASISQFEKRCCRNVYFSYALVLAGVMEAVEDTAGAEAAYRNALRCAPGHAPTEIRLGALLMMRGETSQGLKLINEAASAEPANAEQAAAACAAAAKKRMTAGDVPGAVGALQCAHSLMPEVMEYRVELAGVLGTAGDDDRALGEYRATVAEASESPHSCDGIDAVYLRRNDPAARLAEWKSLVQDHPDAAMPRLHLGMALEDSGDADGAEASYREAIRLLPEWQETKMRLGAIIAAGGNVEEGLRLLDEAVRAMPNLARAAAEGCGRAAKARVAAGDLPHALALLRKARVLSPADLRYRVTLGEALEAARNDDGALGEYRATVAEVPESPKSSGRMDFIFEKRGDKAARVEAWKSLAAAHPEAAIPKLHLGLALEAAGDRAGARQAYANALEINPALVEARAALDKIGGSESGPK